MPLVVADLAAKLGLDDSAFNRGLNGVEGRAGRLTSVLNGVSRAAMAGAVAAGVVVVKSLKTYEDFGGTVAKLTTLTGMSSEAASTLTGQWKRFGVEATAGTTATRFLAKNLDAAQQGGKPLIETFKRLGVAITNSDGSFRQVGDVLPEVRDKFSEMTNAGERTALAMKLFGRGGADVLKWLTKSKTEIAAVNVELEGLGMVWDDKKIANWKQLKDAQREMGLQWTGLQLQLAETLLPVLKDLMGTVNGLIGGWNSLGDGTKGFIVKATGVVGVLGLIGPKAFAAVKGIAALKAMLAGGKLVGEITGGAGGVGGAVASGPLDAAISANTVATEANTLALGGKGGLPGGGGGPVATIAKTAGMSAAAATGVTIGTFAAMSALPLVLARTQKAVDASMSVSEKRSVGSVGGGAFWGSSKGFHGGIGANRMRLAAEAKAEVDAAQAVVDAGGKNIARSLRASGDKAGAGLASGLARGVGPALQSIQKVRNSAGKTIRMGRLDATQMLNEIARVSRALGGMSSAARTAGNAAANAIRSPAGGGGSYRGHFMAAGGYVPARPGGTPVVLGEGGEGEYVTPESNVGRGGTVLNINVANVHGTDRAAATKLANMAGEIFMQQVRFA